MTSVGPAAVPVSVVPRAVRDAGSERQSGPLRICILVLGCRRSSITHPSHVSSQSVTSVKAVVARGAVAACNGAATRSGRPRQPTHHAQWEAIAHDRASRRKQLAAQMGGRQNPTHTGAAQTPYTSALARCGRRSPLGPISPFQRRRAATRRAEPVSAVMRRFFFSVCGSYEHTRR